MNHFDQGPLSSYNSLVDANLTGFFANARLRRHLYKAGLITRNGEIVSENMYRLNLSRKEHKKQVKDMLAQTIVHKTLDLERIRQAEIRKTLEQIAKIQLVRKVRDSRARKRDEDVLPYLKSASSLRSSRSPHAPKGQYATRGRPGSEPARKGKHTLSVLSSSYDDDDEAVIYLDDEGRPISSSHAEINKGSRHTSRESTGTRRDQADDRHLASKEHRDPKNLASLDTAALRKYVMLMSKMEQGRLGVSPYLIPQIPLPPKLPKGGVNPRNIRRYRPIKNNTQLGSQKRPSTALHPEEPAKLYKGQQESLCEVSMHYYGSTLSLAREQFDRRQEIVVEQQHCGGNTLTVFKDKLEPNSDFSFVSYRHRGYPFSLTIYIDGTVDCRVSTCCEYRHKQGGRIGGKTGHFSIRSISGTIPCYRCQVEKGIEVRSQAVRPKLKRPPKNLEEVRVQHTDNPKTTKSEANKTPKQEQDSKKQILVPVEPDEQNGNEKYEDDFEKASSKSDNSSNSSSSSESDQEDNTTSSKNLDLTTAKVSKKMVEADSTNGHHEISSKKGDAVNDRKKPEKAQKKLSISSSPKKDTKKDESEMHRKTLGHIEVPVEDSPRPTRHTKSTSLDVSAIGERAATEARFDQKKLDNRSEDNNDAVPESAVETDEYKNTKQTSVSSSSALQENKERHSRPSSALSSSSSSSSSFSSSSSSSSSSVSTSSSSSSSSSSSRSKKRADSIKEGNDDQKDMNNSLKPEEEGAGVKLSLEPERKDNKSLEPNNDDHEEVAHTDPIIAEKDLNLLSVTSSATRETKDVTEFQHVEEEAKEYEAEGQEEELYEDSFPAMMSFIEVGEEEIESDEEAAKQNLGDTGQTGETASVLAKAEDEQMEETFLESTAMEFRKLKQETEGEAESDDNSQKLKQEKEEEAESDDNAQKHIPDVSSASSASMRSSPSSSSLSDAASVLKQKPKISDSRSTSPIASDHTAEDSKDAATVSDGDLPVVVMGDSAAAAIAAASRDNNTTPEVLEDDNPEAVFQSNSPKHEIDQEQTTADDGSDPLEIFENDTDATAVDNHSVNDDAGKITVDNQYTDDDAEKITAVDNHSTDDDTEKITAVDSELLAPAEGYSLAPAGNMESLENQPATEASEDPIIQRLIKTAAVLSTVQMTKGKEGNDSDSDKSSSHTRSNPDDLAPTAAPQAVEGSLTPLLKRSESVVEIKNLQLQKFQLDEAAAYIQSNEGIQEFHMVNCGLDDEGVWKVLEALKESPSNPVVVNLSHNQLTSASVNSILAVLKKKPSVEAIILRDTRLGDGGVCKLLDGITRLHTEKMEDLTENGQPCKIRELDLRNCRFGNTGAEALAQMIKSSDAINVLNLSSNKTVASDGWVAIGEALAENNSLEKLVLDHNSIGNEGMEYITDSLKNNTSVTSLDLSFVDISERGGQSLMNMFKKNTTIVEIDLEGNDMSQRLQEDIQKYISFNRQMHSIDK